MLGNAAKPRTVQANNNLTLQAVPSSAEMLGNAAKPRTVPVNSNLVLQDVPSTDATIRPSSAVASTPAAEILPSNAAPVTTTEKRHWWSRWWSE
jgi:hypothetical protein